MNDIYEKFKTYKVDIEGKSPSSISTYIYRFQEYANDNNFTTKEQVVLATADIVKNWLVKLAEKENSASTRNSKLTAIKEIYKYLGEEEGERIDLRILKIKFARTPKRETKYLDKEDMVDFLRSIGNLRTKAASSIIMRTGVRYCELITLTCEQIEKGEAHIIGKGNKERTIYFPPDCLYIVKKYIEKKRKHIVEANKLQTNLLFISDNGNPLSKWGFTKSLKYYGKRFNENPLTKGRMEWWKELSPHKLRHSFATNLLKERNIAVVRDALGHENIATTNRYVHAKEIDIKEAMLGGKKWDDQER